MRAQSAATLSEWCQGRLLQGDPNSLIVSVSTDTRTIQPGGLFVALAGEKFDAHNFLPQAAAAGASAFLVSRELPHYPPGIVILVDDTLLGLQRLAHHWRRSWNGKVLGITGSNGKTSTKDMVAAVLSRIFTVTATKGNFNNHIGLPLTVLAVNEEDEIAVCEMGMNHPGEIAPLATIAGPNAAIITTIGNGPSAFIKSLPITLERGRIPVNRELQVVSQENVWAIGDAALIPLNADADKPLSKTAAKKLAKELAARGETEPQQVDEILGFTLDEIREARLVPEVSFKGRVRREATPASEVAVDEAQELGGQKNES